jgi:RNA polymerase sigma factor (sigma-70 family)
VLRAELIAAHLGHARSVARAARKRWHLPGDPEDLEQAAMEGLVQAADRWESDGAATFKTYSEHRIRGAVVDAARAESRWERMTAGPAADAEAPEGDADAWIDVRDGLGALPARTSAVLVRRAEGWTLRELAVPLGVSIMRVSQIASEGRKTLREAVAA